MSRPGAVICSYPGLSTVRIHSVHETQEDARKALRADDAVGGYVMDLVYSEGSREPVAGDVCAVEAPNGGRMYGRIVAPQVST